MIAALLFLSLLFAKHPHSRPAINPFPFVSSIPLPAGYTRVPVPKQSFAAWLRQLPLRSNQTVYLYNGQPKLNQSAQYAVLDLPIGRHDLQQCADAIMRLRAEWLYQSGHSNEIDFMDNNHTHYTLQEGSSLNSYLERVFVHCGTASLEKQLVYRTRPEKIEGGDVLIKGGSPGHAMLVVDVAQNAGGQRIFLLAQGYMPAQDIHIVRNPANDEAVPWYEAVTKDRLETPEWTFMSPYLKTWAY